MSSQRHCPSTRQLLILISTLLLCGSSFHTTFGQDFDWKIGDSSPNRSPNPPSNIKRFASNRSTNGSKQTPGNLPQPSLGASTDEKQKDIEQAIADGNQARDKNNYEQALDHYRKAETLNPKEARAFYGIGNLYSDLSCYDSAIESYRSALTLKKDYLEALLGLGYAFMSKERYDESEKQFQAAHNLKPNNIEANLGIGRVYAKKGKYQEAITQINLVINDKSIENKDRAIAYFALGVVYEDQSKWQDAITQYEKAITLNPDLAIVYFKLGGAQTVVAFSKFASLIAKERRSQDIESFSASARQAGENIQQAISYGFKHPVAYLALGHALMHQSNYQSAVRQFNAYLDKVKELENRLSSLDKNIAAKCDYGFSRLYAAGYLSLGFMYVRQSDMETNNQRKTEILNEAIKPLEQAINLKQDYANAYSLLGGVYLELGKYEAAVEQYKKALLYETKESNKAGTYSNIGMLYTQMGRYNEALNYYKQAIELDPNNSSNYSGLSLIYKAQGNFDEAIVLMKKMMELEPRATPKSYLFLASAYYNRARNKGNDGDYVEAIRLSKKALEINNAFASAYLLLGHIYKFYKAGAMADEALANYTKAAEYDPKNPAIYFNIADLYSGLKRNYEAAIEYYRKAIEIKPDYAQAYRGLGHAYRQKNNDAEAIKQMLKAMESDPKYLDAYFELAEIYKDQKNYSEAIKYLERATELAHEDFYPYKELAKIYEEQQKNKDAIHYYEEAMSRLKPDDSLTKTLYLGRIARLKGQYAEAIEYFRKVSFPDEPGQPYFEIGLTYVVSRNKRAALEQHQQLVQLKSPLADELLRKIKEMK